MCLFCTKLLDQNAIIYENELCVVFEDGFPVSKGHCLIVPKRHIPTYFEATLEEKKMIDDAIMVMKSRIDQQYCPDGYNMGINNGQASGQTIFLLHVHLIPRYNGDVTNPKGGVRGVIPTKQHY
jgi:diadenosine tetraphosphate (Ap4A) HIT family hydrolase